MMNSGQMELIKKMRDRWVGSLMDVSRRSKLLYLRETSSTLHLSQHDARQLDRLISNSKVLLNKLIPSERLEASTTINRLRKIRRDATANLEEKGLDTLFLTLGIATWTALDGGSPANAPVILIPIKIESAGRWSQENLSLQRSGNIQINSVLLYELQSKFGVPIDGENLLLKFISEDETIRILELYDYLRTQTSTIKGFNIEHKVYLSNFAYQKMAMVEDLQRNVSTMSNHPLIKALAGDEKAKSELRARTFSIDPTELDKISPDNEFLVLDADSSQQSVIAAVQGKQHLVIQGPPGTGKSQTIANLITSLIAANKKVLFVAEKRAALEVVAQRLERKGLGYLTLDLHGADLSTRQIIQKLNATLSTVREALPIQADVVHQPFTRERELLNQHAASMHHQHAPLNLSIYTLQGNLLGLPQDIKDVRLRWQKQQIDKLNQSTVLQIEEIINELKGLSDVFLQKTPSVWFNVGVTNKQDIQALLAMVNEIAGQSLFEFRSRLTTFCATYHINSPNSLTECREMLADIISINGIIQLYSTGLFQEDLKHYEMVLSKGKNALSGFFASLTNQDYKNVRKRLKQLQEIASSKQLGAGEHYKTVSTALQKLSQWQEKWSKGYPIEKPFDIETLTQSLKTVIANVESFEKRVKGNNFVTLSLDELNAKVIAFIDDATTAYQYIRVLELKSDLTNIGVATLIPVFQQDIYQPHQWMDLFHFVLWSSIREQILQDVPNLRGFKGETHQSHVRSFARFDKERLQLAIHRIKRAHAESVINVLNKFPDQDDILRKELQKSRRHRPIRKLLSDTSDILLALCPCWMASPLSVSQLMDANKRYFDVVLFDEASQILPHDAVPAIMRAEQVVVAGDKHQLPPTTFFAGEGGNDNDEESEGEDIEGLDSLLDLMAAFVSTKSLQWHYRSRDEALIAFSNHHIYGDALVTFPSTGKDVAMNHVLVSGVTTAGQEESSAAEVQQVIELIKAHAKNCPNESLGVITMGIKHANRIELALGQARNEDAALAAFIEPDKAEKFFVKNLERVQGDERDAIILSIGYGKTPEGKLPYRFGPLLQKGGERRLNVAVTRARTRMTLVSSFSHTDMDPNRSSARGVILLRQYLEYAASQGSVLGQRQSTSIPMNSFEQAVYDALTAEGLKLIPQWGVSTYRLDFAVQHPDEPGRFVMAIECDGATYHSAPTARDRDRLRQQHLEALGWQICRIWSTDWFLNPKKEVDRVVSSYYDALKSADKPNFQQPQTSTYVPQFQSVVTAPVSAHFKPRPQFTPHLPIDSYADKTLLDILNWINSDGKLRTDTDLMNELVRVLEYKRRGPKIEERLNAIIRQWRAKK